MKSISGLLIALSAHTLLSGFAPGFEFTYQRITEAQPGRPTFDACVRSTFDENGRLLSETVVHDRLTQDAQSDQFCGAVPSGEFSPFRYRIVPVDGELGCIRLNIDGSSLLPHGNPLVSKRFCANATRTPEH